MAISHTILQWILDSFAVIDLKMLLGGFGVRDDNSEVRIWKYKNGGSNIAVTYSKFNNFFILLLLLAEKLLLGDF